MREVYKVSNLRKMVLTFVIITAIIALLGANLFSQVYNRTQVTTNADITAAIAAAASGDLLEVEPGIYNEAADVTIAVSGITLRALSWTQKVNTNTIINVGIIISAADVTIQGFTIQKSAGDGVTINVGADRAVLRNCIMPACNRGIMVSGSYVAIDLTVVSNTIKNSGSSAFVIGFELGASSATISHNKIYSNEGRAILCRQHNFVFISNEIYANGIVDDNEVVEIRSANNTEWIGNNIYDNNNYIEFRASQNHRFIGNILKNNNTSFFYTENCSGVVYSNNTICSNNIGINMVSGRGNNARIINNEMYDNLKAINATGANDNPVIRGNTIYDSGNIGIDFENFANGVIELNTVKRSVNIGIDMSGASLPSMVKNNIFSNTVNLNSDSATVLVATNNWWGTVVKSDIDALITGTGTVYATNYRLFGEFDIAEGADTERPPAITSVSKTSNGSDVRVTWSMPAVTNDVVRYFVYRTTNYGATNLSTANIIDQVPDVNTTSYTDVGNSGLYSKYFYYITSLDNHPVYTNESWYSLPSSPADPPAIPGNLAAVTVATDYSALELSWDDVLFETSYTLYYSTNISMTNMTNIGFPANAVSFYHSGLDASTTYYYWIKAYNDNGSLGYSAIASNTTPSDIPIAPTNVVAVTDPVDYENIDISWDDVNYETSYTLYRSTNLSITNSSPVVRGANVTNYTHTGVNTNTTYYYWVKAFNANGGSDYSIVASNTTPSPTPPSPPSFVTPSFGAGYIYVVWENVINETGYILYISTNNFDTTNTSIARSKNITNYTYLSPPPVVHYFKVVANNIAGSSSDSVIGIADFNVFNRTRSIPYATISDALSEVLQGEMILVNPGTYGENLTINVTGFTLLATSWTQATPVNTNTIIMGGITIGANIDNVVMQGFTVQNGAGHGITFSGNSDNVEIRNNRIVNCSGRGMLLAGNNNANILVHSNYFKNNSSLGMFFQLGGSSANSVTISNNEFYSNGYRAIYARQTGAVVRAIGNIFSGHGPNGGIELSENATGEIIGNTFYGNDCPGITLTSCNGVRVAGNIIYNNTMGISITGGPNSIISNNIIYSNSDGTNATFGIGFDGGDNTRIIDNEVYENPVGIRVGNVAGVEIKRNLIHSSWVAGLGLQDLSGAVIELNTIKNETNAGIIVSGNAASIITKNNIYSNAISVSNESTVSVILTNNWWNTTIYSNIRSQIIGGAGGFDASVYRLFGPFDTSYGADTDKFPTITGVSAGKGNGIELVWNPPASPIGLSGYNIYRSKTAGVTNFTSADVYTNVVTTNFTDQAIDLVTNYYYYVTALDDYPVYTNESWYSAEVSYALTDLPEPHNFSVKSLIMVDSTNAVLSWETTLFADGFQISTNKITYITNVGAGVTAFTDSSVTNMQVITYYIRATNSATNSAWLSNTITIISGPPSQISNVVAHYVLPDSVSLSWQSDSKAASYVLYNNAGSTNMIAIAPGTNYIVTNLQAGTPYSFSVKGTNYAGASSNYSAPLNLSTAYAPPAVVSVRVADSMNCTVIWSNVGADGYIVLYGTNLSAPITNNTGQTQFVLNSISFTSQHYVKVWGTNSSMDSSLVLAAPAETNLMVTGFYAVSQLTNFSAVAYATNQTILTWSDTDGETGYAISRGTLGNVITNLAMNVTSWTDTSIFVNTNIPFYIIGTNSDGYSTVSVSTASYEIPGTPVMDTNYTILANTNVIISWSPADLFEDGYRILTNGVLYRTVSKTVTTITDDTVAAMPKTNDYQVVATNALGASLASTPALTIIVGVPEAPVLDTFAANVDSITISWSNVDNAVSYMIISAAGSTNAALSTNYVTNTLTYKYTGLQAGAVYYYRLAAINALGVSPLGVWLNQSTLAGFADELNDGDVLVQSTVKLGAPYLGILHMKGMTEDTKITMLNGGGDLVKSWNVSDVGSGELAMDGEYLCIDLSSLGLANDVHTVVLEDGKTKVVRHFNYLSE